MRCVFPEGVCGGREGGWGDSVAMTTYPAGHLILTGVSMVEVEHEHSHDDTDRADHHHCDKIDP